MLETLDAAAVGRWIRRSAASLAEHRAEIDDLNVYPVPDGDTGTNLVQTIDGAARALSAAAALRGTAEAPAGAGAALRVLADAAVFSARGNSGVIAAQILRGFADALSGAATIGADGLRGALVRGADEAMTAVAEPESGTMLSVMRAAADSAEASARGAGLGELIRAVVRGADEALTRTPEQLAVLARAGVVDAGGRGLLLLLDALAEEITGASAAVIRTRRPGRARRAVAVAREAGSAEFGFEVQYLLEVAAGQEPPEALRAELAALGDSVVVITSQERSPGRSPQRAQADSPRSTWNVHVHTNDIGAVIEAGVELGRPRRITVASFADQVAAIESRAASPDGGCALVAIRPGEGLRELFEGEGVTVVDAAPADGAQLVRLIPAARAVLLADSADVGAELERIVDQARASGIELAVVPTRSPLQALAAVAVHDAGRRFDDDVIAMAEAAAATRFAEVRVAEREALTTVGRVCAGDVLGLIDGEVVQVGDTVGGVALAIADRLLGTGGELITVLLGRGAALDAGAALRRHIAHVAPLTEVVVYEAGQVSCPLLIGME